MDWKTENEILIGLQTIKPTDDMSASPDSISLEDIKSLTLIEAMTLYDPHLFVKKPQKWCLYKNSQTTITKNICKLMTKKAYKMIVEALPYFKQMQPFTTRDIINYFNANNVTNGDIQRRVMSALVCNGLITKDIKGKSKFRYEYTVNDNQVICEFLCQGKCKYKWKDAERTELDMSD